MKKRTLIIAAAAATLFTSGVYAATSHDSIAGKNIAMSYNCCKTSCVAKCKSYGCKSHNCKNYGCKSHSCKKSQGCKSHGCKGKH
ncbi:MAG: hypothetical protein H0U73_08115 [Tatlockia sp.]|nr:hypothetical protein [Tatlockia sp.]